MVCAGQSGHRSIMQQCNVMCFELERSIEVINWSEIESLPMDEIKASAYEWGKSLMFQWPVPFKRNVVRTVFIREHTMFIHTPCL